MKILWLARLGIGNIVQQIPAYLNIKELAESKGGFVDVAYFKQYDTESKFNACMMPVEHILELNPMQTAQAGHFYDYVIKPPFIFGDDGYVVESVDSMREYDSEVKRYMKVCDTLKADNRITKVIKTMAMYSQDMTSSPDRINFSVNGVLKPWVSVPHPGIMLTVLRKKNDRPIVTITMAYTGSPTRDRKTVRSRSVPINPMTTMARRALILRTVLTFCTRAPRWTPR